jgi:hypothetical protein
MKLGTYTNIKEGFKYANSAEIFNDVDGSTYINICNNNCN